MRTLIILFMLTIPFSMVNIGCQDIEIGYLITEYAGYSLDSLVINYELDATPPEEVSNPEYQMYLDMGFSPEEIAMFFQIYTTMLVGGGEDWLRVTYGMPWTSTPIEGIEGSNPIWCQVKSITSEGGDADKLAACISVRGNGVLSVPVENDVPRGRYSISLNFWNEGRSKDVNNCFTIIVR